MYKFELDKAQMQKFEKWKNTQENAYQSRTTLGERWTFCFTPTGLGIVVSVIDNATKDTLELTNWSDF
jgi:hypothetical protein